MEGNNMVKDMCESAVPGISGGDNLVEAQEIIT